jgi:2-polyprenyl-3-methyl-5-hydroxy-6-metoxy-1,4-benzoquinol methylase
MPTRDYHEAIWEALPEPLAPSDFALRSEFLLARVSPGERVLDLGCGEGQFAAALDAAGASVLAVDVAREPLRRARAAHPQLELGLIEGEGAWALPDAGFDVVWAGEVIEHVADTSGWLSEVRRVLAPGGRLLLSTPAHGPLTRLRVGVSSRAFARAFEPRGEHLRFYTSATLSRLLADFRFEDVELSAAGAWPLRPLLLGRAVRSRH